MLACVVATSLVMIAANAPKPALLTSDAGVRRAQAVTVYGFSITDRAFETRQQALEAGFAAAARHDGCRSAECAFLVMRDGARWLVTNAATLGWEDLIELRASVADDDTMIVLRPPPGASKAAMAADAGAMAGAIVP